MGAAVIGGCSSKTMAISGCSSVKVPKCAVGIVSRDGLRREFPRLYAELIASDHKDTPRVVGAMSTLAASIDWLRFARDRRTLCASCRSR